MNFYLKIIENKKYNSMSYIISLILISVPHSAPVPLTPCHSSSLYLLFFLPENHFSPRELHSELCISIWVFVPSFNLDLYSNRDLKSKRFTLAIFYKIDYLLWSQFIFISCFTFFSFLTLITICIYCENRDLLLFPAKSQPGKQ